MYKSRGVAALLVALAVLCAVVALEWYAHVGGGHAAPRVLSQISAAPSPTATAAATAAPSPTSGPVMFVPQTPAPRPHGTGTVTVTPQPGSTPYAGTNQTAVADEPLVAATLAPHIVAVKPIAEPPNAPPRILAMSLSTPVAHGGQIVSGTVETSSNVASVEARVGGYSSTMQKVGVGKFRLSYRVPRLPFFLHRTYNIEIIARNTRGDAVHTSVPITIR